METQCHPLSQNWSRHEQGCDARPGSPYSGCQGGTLGARLRAICLLALSDGKPLIYLRDLKTEDRGARPGKGQTWALPSWGPLGLLFTQALGTSDINKPPHWLRVYGWVTPNVDRNFQKLSEPSRIFQLQICLESALSIGVETHKSVQKIRKAGIFTNLYFCL